MVNSPRPPPSNIVELSPTTHLMDVYQRFFDGHPELLCPHGHSHHVTIGHDDPDSFEDQVLYSSEEISDNELDMEMEMVLDSPPLLIRRARAMADERQMVPRNIPLIADQEPPNETAIDTIHLMIQSPPSSNTASSGNTHHNMLGRQQHQQQQHSHAQGAQGHNHTTNSNNNTNNTTSSTSSSSTNGTNTQGNDSHPNNNAANNHNRSDDSSSPPDQNQNQAPQRRKKASRACFHCQKAHLTCDDSRPCQRCVKRDLAATCADGVRKKAKYLQDAYDSQQQQSDQGSQPPQGNMLGGLSDHLSDQDQMQRHNSMEESPLADATSLFNFPMSADYGFGSEAVNLEYSIISTMLSSPTAELNAMSDLSMVESWRQGSLEAMSNNPLANNSQLQKALAGANGTSLNNNTTTTNNNNNSQQQQQQQQQLQQQQPQINGSSTGNANGLPLVPPATNGNPAPVFAHPTGGRASKRKFPSNTPENVYANTKQPFNYTDGFHYLLRYVRERMDREEMMRICRAMAMFRPSFIALIMNLTPEDLIFMEKCFQRTILEFEKLISFSGTPTVVWRRTGEIALVGKEFSLLTQWGRDQLVGKKTYIYELMDNQSAVEYWEKFSTHAFENTEQTVMTTCILLSPTNRVVPCTFCFTIKRDIFDIPLAIVGNFLPILS
ncbi:Transcriptional regulator of nonfermentable carbon utilization [Mortierella antarctica]|nr:Transcriptional regulator of nonfermentable carbon utilization [Mortierella antarctica]